MSKTPNNKSENKVLKEQNVKDFHNLKYSFLKGVYWITLLIITFGIERLITKSDNSLIISIYIMLLVTIWSHIIIYPIVNPSSKKFSLLDGVIASLSITVIYLFIFKYYLTNKEIPIVTPTQTDTLVTIKETTSQISKSDTTKTLRELYNSHCPNPPLSESLKKENEEQSEKFKFTLQQQRTSFFTDLNDSFNFVGFNLQSGLVGHYEPRIEKRFEYIYNICFDYKSRYFSIAFYIPRYDNRYSIGYDTFEKLSNMNYDKFIQTDSTINLNRVDKFSKNIYFYSEYELNDADRKHFIDKFNKQNITPHFIY